MTAYTLTMRFRSLLGFPLLCACAVVLTSCNKMGDTLRLSAEDNVRIVEENLRHRAEVDTFFRSDPNSPFTRDTSISYGGINWFPVNPLYRGRSVLHRYDNPETVIVLGTKGEERPQLQYGYFEFSVPDEDGELRSLKMNVYKFTPYDTKRYALYKDHLSLWFTDRTTGHEAYEVGRYIELGVEHPEPAYVYTIDLNMAYNPYCAYSDLYSCAIPRKEDHLEIALRVGEMKYHE